jgi:hypothetical protein
LRVGSKIILSSQNQSPKRIIEMEIAQTSPQEQEKIRVQGSPTRFPFVLRIKGNQVPPDTFIPVSEKGGLPQEALDVNRRIQVRPSQDLERAHFITTDSFNSATLVSMWEHIVLTESEQYVLNAIQFLDPSVERIASQSASPFYNVGRGGFKVKQRDVNTPIPIGSMGDGMWRMLAISIILSRSKGGVLLIDEIDTGLHYKVMAEMWKFVHKVAKKLNVQIFATTHSSDCVNSLATICENLEPDDHVTLNRIEAGKDKSIPYTQSEIQMAAKRGIEMRG